MAKILSSNNLSSCDELETFQAYNCLDCCITREIADVLLPKVEKLSDDIYDFERACQGPAMTMMLRGVLIDEEKRKEAIKALKKAERDNLKRLISDAKGFGYEATVKLPNSYKQLPELLYDRMGLKRQFTYDRKLTTDKNAIWKLIEKYPEHREFLNRILDVRTEAKHRQIFETGLGPDGRLHSTFNVGAAETDRWSTGLDCFKAGASLHGIPKKLRYPFIPDPGMLMAQPDLEQAESRVIAYLAKDEGYIKAHEEGNVHVNVGVKVAWPEGIAGNKGWSKDMKENAELIKTTPSAWDVNHTYYDYCKRLQHGMNFGLAPKGVAKHSGLPFEEARKCYHRYHEAYPGIQGYHRWVVNEIKTKGYLVNPWGRKREFFGRPWDAATHREGYSHLPQNIVTTITAKGLLKIWEEFDPWRVELLCFSHDGILFQFQKDDYEIVDEAVEMLKLPVEIHGREMVIPVDVNVGKNWKEVS